MLLINDRFPLKIDRGGKRVLVLNFVRVLFHLNLFKVDRKRRQHAELQVKVARAAVRDHNSGDAVVSLMDLELLEITELDRSGNIRVKTVSHKVIPSGYRRVVAFKLDMPGFSVGLRRIETIDAVDSLAASLDIVSFEFGAEHRGRHFGRRHFVPVFRLRPYISVFRQRLERLDQIRIVISSCFLCGNSFRFCFCSCFCSFFPCLLCRCCLTASTDQKSQHEKQRDQASSAFH